VIPGGCDAAEPLWRLSLFAFELRAVGDATAAALPSASDAPTADIRDSDSTADSSTARRRSGHSLSADKRMMEIDSKNFPAAMTVTRCDTGSVLWEWVQKCQSFQAIATGKGVPMSGIVDMIISLVNSKGGVGKSMPF